MNIKEIKKLFSKEEWSELKLSPGVFENLIEKMVKLSDKNRLPIFDNPETMRGFLKEPTDNMLDKK